MTRIRIIAGQFGSRLIDTPAKASIHPMSERMRGALFNSLGDISGKSLLDAFAGSGAVGLEAVSRGARVVTLIEQDRQANAIIRQNINLLKIKSAKLIQANVFGWAERNGEKFDIIVADPPYERVDAKKVVDKLKNHLNTNGIMILSHTGRAEPPIVDGVVVVETRSYANGTLTFYRSQ